MNLKCSIRGTNNELPNRFHKFVHLQLFNFRFNVFHLQLFNIRYKFVHLQLFDVKFLFSESHIFRKQKRTAVYGRASLALDFKLTAIIMTCYLRNTNKFLRYLWKALLPYVNTFLYLL